jgi:lambda repressor-like predicted transcriptional regulator
MASKPKPKRKPGPKKNMHPAYIKAALAEKGYTMARLSREMGYRQHNCANQVLYRPWPKVEKKVAEITGIPREVIWPERCRPTP